ncbi:MAG: hypothetical protein ACTSU2_00245 [Promethearchaeota archaeon]
MLQEIKVLLTNEVLIKLKELEDSFKSDNCDCVDYYKLTNQPKLSCVPIFGSEKMDELWDNEENEFWNNV